MQTAKKKAKKPKRSSNAVEYTKPPEEVPTFYVNNTNGVMSVFDLRLTFSQIVDSTDKGVRVNPQVVVLMSPQHAKAIVDLITGQIEKYEEMTGQSLSSGKKD